MLRLKIFSYQKNMKTNDGLVKQKQKRFEDVPEIIFSFWLKKQAAGKLLDAGKLIDQSPSAIKLRTLPDIV